MKPAAYEGNESYIFISYAHKDAARVLPVIAALSRDRFRLWYDAGIEADMYVLVDWHILNDSDPNQHTEEAAAFFGRSGRGDCFSSPPKSQSDSPAMISSAEAERGCFVISQRTGRLLLLSAKR